MGKSKVIPFKLSTHHFSLSAASGVLLTLCFPKFSLGFLAWFSLIPLLTALNNCHSTRRALLCGFLAGIVFFGFSLHWMIHVTTFGWIFLALMEAAYIMLFGWLVSLARKSENDFLKVIWIASAWTSMEMIRSEMPVFGLGWNLLGYSQSDYPWILQSANTIGAYGLGFVIALVNACIFQILSRMKALNSKSETLRAPNKWFLSFPRKRESIDPRLKSAKQHGRIRRSFGGGHAGMTNQEYTHELNVHSIRTGSLFFILAAVFTLLLTHGYFHFNRKNSPDQSIRISLIQGNIPQDIKWEPVARDKIIEIYTKMTQLVNFENPDLILWPEAAFPGYFNRDSEADKIHQLIRELKKPFVIGSPHFESWQKAYNSAYLLGPDAQVLSRYDKLYLVPFGEYVPLKPVFGWLEPMAYSLGVSDFSPGEEFTIFNLQSGISFAVLICFEDVFPDLARNFVNRGARFLAVITNDAWFGHSAAPYQHLQASIFRAVENGVPVVRAANTGVSAFISKKGVVLDRVRDQKGEDIFVFGKSTLTLPLEKSETLYRRGGYLFPYLVALVFGVLLVAWQFRPKFTDKGQKAFILWSFVFGLVFFPTGCVRVAGKAGYWHQGPEDESAKVKQAGFDTQDIIQKDKEQGSIEIDG